MPDDFLKSLTSPEEKPESYKPETFEAVTKPSVKAWWIVLPVAMVLGGLGWFFTQPKVIIPDMEGWSVSDASTWAQRNEVQLVLEGQYAALPADTVLHQIMDSGSTLSSGEVLELTISWGPDPLEILDLNSLLSLNSKTEAIEWLETHAVENFTFVTVIDDDALPGTILGVQLDPDDGELMRSDAVVITISAQSVPLVLTVPDFTGFSAAAAEAWGETNGIEVTISRSYSLYVAKEKLISQSLSEGSAMTNETTLILEYSAGIPVTIPNFKTLTPEAAKAWASAENIALTIENRYSSTPNLALISQSLKAGTTVETQSKLTVVYSLGPVVNLGNYVNQSLIQLKSTLDGLNALGANLTLSMTEQYSTSVSVNRIIALSVSDTGVPIGSTLEVIVSLGSLVEVPDFSLSVKASWVETYNAILSSAKTANATIRITVIDDPQTDVISITQSMDPGLITSSAVLIDVVMTH